MLSARLNDIDVKIIKDLLEDGRKSFSSIAKECNVSSATISERFKKLEELGIIAGSTILYNCSILGYRGLATLLLNVESQNVNNVLERLKEKTHFFPKRQYNAEHNIFVITAWKSARDLDIVKESIRRQNPIVECKTYLWSDVGNQPENLVIGTSRYTKKKSDQSKEPTISKIEVDKKDIEIVNRLIKNGRTPFRTIAQEIGISTDTVSKRYQKLKENCLIRTCIQINPQKLGYQSIVDFSLAFTSHDKIDNIIKKILKIPNVSYVVKVEGDFDLHVAALARDVLEIFAINEEITKIPNIKKIEAALRKAPTAWPSSGQQISTFGQGMALT
jgi:Lrp/AsnC family transcriptional regulator for asnA, asnC and gidA